MPSINNSIVMGHLVRTPDLRSTPSGSPVCDITLALNRKANGREDVCYVDVVAWGKNAENCGKYLDKGSCLLVEGYLKQESWDDRSSGQKRTKLKLVAEKVQFISSPRNGDNRAQNRSTATHSRPELPPAPQNSAGYAPEDEPGYVPEGDIPF